MASASAVPMQPDVETGADYAEADPGDNGDKSEDHVSGASTPVNENKKDENEDSGAASSKREEFVGDYPRVTGTDRVAQWEAGKYGGEDGEGCSGSNEEGFRHAGKEG